MAGVAEEDEGPQTRDVTEVHACQVDMDIPGLIGEAVQRGDQACMSDRVHVSRQGQQVPGCWGGRKWQQWAGLRTVWGRIVPPVAGSRGGQLGGCWDCG